MCWWYRNLAFCHGPSTASSGGLVYYWYTYFCVLSTANISVLILIAVNVVWKSFPRYFLAIVVLIIISTSLLCSLLRTTALRQQNVIFRYYYYSHFQSHWYLFLWVTTINIYTYTIWFQMLTLTFRFYFINVKLHINYVNICYFFSPLVSL